MNATLIEAPPGLKSCIKAGVSGIDFKNSERYCFKETSGKLKIQGTAKEITSAPDATLAFASWIAILREGLFDWATIAIRPAA